MIQCMAETSRSKDARMAIVYSKEDQIKRVNDVECLAFFYTTNAFINFQPHTRRPYIMFLGEVAALEGDFPYGIGHVDFKEGARPQMNCRYDLSNDEIGDIARKGLYEPGFPIPGIFVENTLEIPISCDCVVVQPGENAKQDPPLAFFDVPGYVTTTSEASGYEINTYFTTYKNRVKINNDDRLYTEHAPEQSGSKSLQGREANVPDVDISIPQRRDKEAELIAQIVAIVESQIPGMLSEEERNKIEEALEQNLETDEDKGADEHVSDKNILDQENARAETSVSENQSSEAEPNNDTELQNDIETLEQSAAEMVQAASEAVDDQLLAEDDELLENDTNEETEISKEELKTQIDEAEEFMQRTREQLDEQRRDIFEEDDVPENEQEGQNAESNPDTNEILMDPEDEAEREEEEKAFV